MLNQIEEQIIHAINVRLDTDFIILFGSFAKGNGREDSDLDVAYFSNVTLSSYDRFLLACELATIVGREVDLIDLKQVDTVLTMQIFSTGIPIYIKNNNEYILQKMRAYSMYATLSERRAPIINAIKERGSVYGDE